jgi:hypothetical protein
VSFYGLLWPADEEESLEVVIASHIVTANNPHVCLALAVRVAAKGQPDPGASLGERRFKQGVSRKGGPEQAIQCGRARWRKTQSAKRRMVCDKDNVLDSP